MAPPCRLISFLSREPAAIRKAFGRVNRLVERKGNRHPPLISSQDSLRNTFPDSSAVNINLLTFFFTGVEQLLTLETRSRDLSFRGQG